MFMDYTAMDLDTIMRRIKCRIKHQALPTAFHLFLGLFPQKIQSGRQLISYVRFKKQLCEQVLYQQRELPQISLDKLICNIIWKLQINGSKKEQR